MFHSRTDQFHRLYYHHLKTPCHEAHNALVTANPGISISYASPQILSIMDSPLSCSREGHNDQCKQRESDPIALSASACAPTMCGLKCFMSETYWNIPLHQTHQAAELPYHCNHWIQFLGTKWVHMADYMLLPWLLKRQGFVFQSLIQNVKTSPKCTTWLLTAVCGFCVPEKNQLDTRITGWWLTYPSEKYEFVSWDDEIPNIWEKCSKPPTRLKDYENNTYEKIKIEQAVNSVHPWTGLHRVLRSSNCFGDPASRNPLRIII